MHIVRPKKGLLDSRRVAEDLQDLLITPEQQQQPPCPGCKNFTPTRCNARCPDAPTALSIDPQQYPLEPNVVSLVYELVSSRLLQTCWSCEGHFDNDGKLWKLPQVSFYSASPVYPQLLLRHVNDLYQARRLAYPWQVVLSDYAQTWGLTYTVEPNLVHVPEPRLGLLHQDLRIISEDLLLKLKEQARKMLQSLE